jgi:hypothetical protein
MTTEPPHLFVKVIKASYIVSRLVNIKSAETKVLRV